MVPVFPDMPSSWSVSWWNTSATALVLPALIVLRTLANLFEQYLNKFIFLHSFFSVSNNNIPYLFPKN